MRDDKDAVLDMLFAAFEKHQYYNIRDLVKITRQPIVSSTNIFYTLSSRIMWSVSTYEINFLGVPERNSQRSVQLQSEKSTQKYVGIET